MGIYLNSTDPASIYQEVVNSPYFVDKTSILNDLIPLLGSSDKYICITRPRRFGKTVMANLIASYFSNACDTGSIFDSLQISRRPDYRKYLNQYDVIYIDFSEIDDECKSYNAYIKSIKDVLRQDLYMAYPEVNYRPNGNVVEDLKRIYAVTNHKFIFVLDEWDAIFHISFVKKKDREAYLRFLRGLLKGKAYAALVYMTGILPIAKYSSGSDLNMFTEFTMAKSPAFSDYFGFTESEIDELHGRYLKNCHNPAVTRDGLKDWYDGYQTAAGERVYNPRSVVQALRYNHLESYWTSSGPYDEIYFYIEKNTADVRDDLALMAAGESVPSKIQEYAATSMNLQTKDEIFSAKVVYGFLSYTNGKVFIPNRELMNQFADMLRKESSLGYIYRLAKESDRMLRATLAGDTETMQEILAYAHDTETPLLSYNYNNEIELTANVNLVYLSARDTYRVEREEKAGQGYADFIFYPEQDKNADCIILELKVDHTPDDAIRQIKARNYSLRFRGKIGEINRYTGRVLAVGIGYDRATKFTVVRLRNYE